MPTFQVDDKFHSHPKRHKAGFEAIGVWCTVGSWCQDHLTDGFIDFYTAYTFAPPDVWAKLVDARLIDKEDDGYRYHKWDHWQQSAIKLLERRRRDAARKKQSRAEKRAASKLEKNVRRMSNGRPADVRAESQRTSRGRPADVRGDSLENTTEPTSVRADVRGTSAGRPGGVRSDVQRTQNDHTCPTDVQVESAQTSSGRPGGQPGKFPPNEGVRADVQRTSVGHPSGRPADVRAESQRTLADALWTRPADTPDDTSRLEPNPPKPEKPGTGFGSDSGDLTRVSDGINFPGCPRGVRAESAPPDPVKEERERQSRDNVITVGADRPDGGANAPPSHSRIHQNQKKDDSVPSTSTQDRTGPNSDSETTQVNGSRYSKLAWNIYHAHREKRYSSPYTDVRGDKASMHKILGRMKRDLQKAVNAGLLAPEGVDAAAEKWLTRFWARYFRSDGTKGAVLEAGHPVAWAENTINSFAVPKELRVEDP